jgi:2-oxoisovalerate dehydrogenase E1 component alpha subunit
MSVSDSDDYFPRRSSPTIKGRSVYSGFDSLPIDRCLDIFRLMVRTRALEERSIKMSKSGEAYFWVGGPGEEAFNVCLGLQILKGRGPAYDYLHLHYRNAGVVLAMGMPMLDHIRQMAMTSTDRHSMGRNFVGHYAIPEWNIPPVSSVIEVQYVVAPGTALMQKRHGGEGVSVVIGGEAGAAEGDFNSCMLWSTRPGNELPVLMVVTNNGYGISTPSHTQHSARHISDRGEPFGIPGEVIDGNDPIAAWKGLERAFDHVRHTRRPFLLEAMVSRLNGHSSSSGAARSTNEPDCLKLFEQKLLETGAAHREWVEMIYHDAHDEVEAAVEVAMNEPRPTKTDVERFTFAPSPVDAVYPNDYTGLPPS